MDRHICNILTSPVLMHVVGCSRCETGSESTRIACDERKQKLFRGNNAARFQEFKCFFFLLVKIKFNLLFVVCLLTKINAIIIPRPSRIYYLDQLLLTLRQYKNNFLGTNIKNGTTLNPASIKRPSTTLVKVTVYPETEYDSVIHLPVLYTVLCDQCSLVWCFLSFLLLQPDTSYIEHPFGTNMID